MQVWRLLIGAKGGLEHLVVSAPDHHMAWHLALEALGAQGQGAVLEELENTGQRAPAQAGVVCRLPARKVQPEPHERGSPWAGGAGREPPSRPRRAKSPRPRRH